MFVAVKMLEKDGKVKKFYNGELKQAYADGWEEVKPKKVEQPTTNEDKPKDNYDDLTYTELKTLAKEKGIENANIKKEELIAFLRGE